MTLALPGAPFPVTYRELWLPPGINENATLPTSIEGGHELALTGARKGTTTNGVHFTGAADSNINCGVIHNAAAKLWISLRFKLDTPHIAGGTSHYLFGKRINANDQIYFYLDGASGRLVFSLTTATVSRFILYAQIDGADVTSWEAGRWYHVLASISDTAGIGRLRVNNDTIVLTNDTNAAPNGGSFIIGARTDPETLIGFIGVIADADVGTDDLSDAEETDLYNGIPPADAVNSYLLDEGRGVTAYDRGSGGNNGTLDTSCTWAFGQVQQPVLSLDRINDSGVSSAGVDISGDITCVWAGKMKSTYDALSVYCTFLSLRVDVNNRVLMIYYAGSDSIQWRVTAGGAAAIGVHYLEKPTIDDYLILIATYTNGIASFFSNGSPVGTEIGGLALPGLAATAYIGRDSGALYDISKPLLIGLIDGAFTPKQALAYSRYLKNVFNLPITI